MFLPKPPMRSPGAVVVGPWRLATAMHALTSPGMTHGDGRTTEIGLGRTLSYIDRLKDTKMDGWMDG